MIIILVVIIKILLFWFPYHYANLAYTDHMILRSYQADQSVLQYRQMTGGNLIHMASINLPEYLIAGESYPVEFHWMWGDIPDEGITFQLISKPEIEGLKVKTMFSDANRNTQEIIVLPASLSIKEPEKITITGVFSSKDVDVDFISPLSGTVWVIPREYVTRLEKDRLKNLILAIASLVIVVLIFIYVW